jgi:hypothetical protein
VPSGPSVDVQSEFVVLFEEASLLALALPRLRADDHSEDRALRWIEIAGVAAAVEKIYSGMERILLLLARHVDGAPIDKTDAWHASLLNRMANPFPGVRGPVISTNGKIGLDRLRSFRHRVRNSYGIALDAEIVLDRAGELAEILAGFHREVSDFLSARDALS